MTSCIYTVHNFFYIDKENHCIIILYYWFLLGSQLMKHLVNKVSIIIIPFRFNKWPGFVWHTVVADSLLFNETEFKVKECCLIKALSMRLTAVMEGFLPSPAGGCVTSAPRKITGCWNTADLQERMQEEEMQIALAHKGSVG